MGSNPASPTTEAQVRAGAPVRSHGAVAGFGTFRGTLRLLIEPIALDGVRQRQILRRAVLAESSLEDSDQELEQSIVRSVVIEDPLEVADLLVGLRCPFWPRSITDLINSCSSAMFANSLGGCFSVSGAAIPSTSLDSNFPPTPRAVGLVRGRPTAHRGRRPPLRSLRRSLEGELDTRRHSGTAPSFFSSSVASSGDRPAALPTATATSEGSRRPSRTVAVIWPRPERRGPAGFWTRLSLPAARCRPPRRRGRTGRCQRPWGTFFAHERPADQMRPRRTPDAWFRRRGAS